MSELEKRLAGLSPEKLELLRSRLKNEAKAAPQPLPPPPAVEPRPEERFQPFPLTDAQEAYWIGRSGVYDLSACGTNSYMEYEFTGVNETFLDRLEWAFQEFVDRHDMLRAVLLPDGRQQVLERVPPIRIQRVNLIGRPAEEVAEEMRRVRDRMCLEKTPIERWPLFEILAHYLDGDRVRLHLRFDTLLKDGRSRGLIFEEVPRLFSYPDQPLPPYECTFRDFAVTRADFRETETWRRCRDYWMERLPALPPAPELPLALDLRPETPSLFTIRNLDLLPQEVWEKVKERATQAGLTASNVAMAAFVEAVAAWSESPRFTLGVVGSDRPPVHPDIERLFGNFNIIHLLAVDDLSGPFQTRARRLQERLAQDLEHRHFSGIQVLREMNRRNGGSPQAAMPIMFNSVIDYGPPPSDEDRPIDDADDTTRMTEIEGSVHTPQTLVVATLMENFAGGLVCKWQAVEEVFPPGLVDGFVDGFVGLLRRLAEDEAAWKGNALQLTPAAHLAAREAPSISADLPQPARIDTRIAALGQEHPERPAVVDAAGTLTCGELCRDADRLAALLREHGAGREVPVALVAPPGRAQITGALAILRAGAVLVPVDPGLTAARIRRLLEQSGAPLALTGPEPSGGEDWPAQVRRLPLDGSAARAMYPFAAAAGDGDLAVILYDPDAAAEPRGVMLDHRSLFGSLLELVRELGISAEDRCAALSPAGSALWFLETFGSLVAGGAVACPEAGAAGEPAAWVDLLSRHGVTVWCSAPALADRLTDHLARHPAGSPGTLRLAVLGGDPVPLRLPERLARRWPGIEVAILGGVPEAGLGSALHRVDPGAAASDLARPRLPWGRALAGQRLHVLDGALDPRPDWVAGDLFLGGEGLARGYWRDDEATRAAFFTHPRSGERLVRTGLAARFLPGGELDVLGPRDEMRTTLSGRRAEPRRVEAALERHPGVRSAVVLPRRDGDGRTRLSAFVALSSGAGTDDIVADLREQLPPALVPAHLEVVEAFPLTPSGRIDRAELARAVHPVPAPPARAPEGPLETGIAALWRELLGAPPASVTDDFFALGGNSLLAVRLMALLAERFGLEGPLPAFFDRPTIAHLAELVRAAQEARAAREKVSPLARLLPFLRREHRERPARPTAATAAPEDLFELTPGMRTFLMIWFGQLVSTLGTGLGSFALGIYVFQETGSATQFSIMAFVGAITGLLLSPLAGALADRWDRRKVILYGDIASSLVALGMAILFYTDRMHPWLAYPVVFLMVGFGTFHQPALLASVSMLVPRRELARASGMVQMGWSISAIACPLLAGLLVGRIGFHGVILIDFTTFLFASTMVLLVRIPRPPVGTGRRSTLLQDFLYGWRYIKERAGLYTMLMLFSMTNFSLGIIQVLLTPLILSFATPAELGSVNSAGAGGALLGGLVLTLWGGPRRRILGIYLVLVAQGLILLLGGLQPSVPLIAGAAFAFMFTGPFATACTQAIWQSKVALEVQGRVFSMSRLLASLTLPISYLAAGPLTDHIFKPLLLPGGPLADSVGRVIGVGEGRGVGLLFMTLGVFVILVSTLSFLNPRLRKVEEELPDAILPEAPGFAEASGRTAMAAPRETELHQA